MDGAVARLILDSLDSTDSKGSMSNIFQNYINSMKKSEEELAVVGSGEDHELAMKLKFLKTCEETKDLGWFDYESWNSFPKSFKDAFTEKIDHLFYGGVFFQYSKLVEIEGQLWKYLTTNHVVTVLDECRNYHIVCTGEDNSRYDKLGEYALLRLKKDFKSRTIRSIAKNSSGQIICVVKGELDD